MDFVRYMTRVYYICTIIVHYYNMKNNYSKRLMDVIEYSREEAARLQNSYIGPEHLMLGIIRDGEGKAVQALRELNVDEWDIKRKIEQEIKNTIDAEDAVQHDIAISKTTERVLRMSMLESRLFKKKETGTEHLLLAILKEEFNVAAKVLNEAGITYRSIYNYLISGTGLKHMDDFIGKEDAEHFEGISDGYTDDDEDDDDDYSSRRESPRSSSGAGSAQPKSPNDTPVLDNFGTDMTRAAAFLPAYFCALYWKKATKQGVMASLWVGTIGSLFALVFLHQKESAALGICKALFGRDVLITTYPFPVIDPILFALPLSVLAIVVISLMTYRK